MESHGSLQPPSQEPARSAEDNSSYYELMQEGLKAGEGSTAYAELSRVRAERMDRHGEAAGHEVEAAIAARQAEIYAQSVEGRLFAWLGRVVSRGQK